MSNQMIGVSPPPLGKATEIKVDQKRDLKETSQGQYKNDFEKTLKEKLAAKEKEKDAEKKSSSKSEAGPPKEARAKKDDKESHVEREKEKSPGGTKKKVIAKVDDPSVSMIMASKESEVETPESKSDLAAIEESQPEQKLAMAAMSKQVQPKELIAKDVGVAMPEVVGSEQKLTAAQMAHARKEDLTASMAEQGLSAEELSPEMLAKIQSQLEQGAQAAPEQMVTKEKLGAQISAELQAAKHRMQQSQEGAEDDSDVVTPKVALPAAELLEASTAKTAAAATEASATAPTSESPLLKELMQKLKVMHPSEASVPMAAAKAAPEAAMTSPVALAAAATAGVAMVAPKELSFEQQLGDEVGFEPSVDNDRKLIASESEGQELSPKAQEFQKSVYDQLQKTEAHPANVHALKERHLAKDQTGSEDVIQQQPGVKAEALNPNELQHVGQSHGEFRNEAGAPALAGSEQHRAQVLEQNHEKNIQEVMNQAQYLVKKGGGEMNVHMSPDGMAEVHLKVVLQDGKVNIEMATQDKAVKKLMEDSLTELKSGLAAQHLNVEHVKINTTVNATNTDNSAQFQSNWNQGGGEHQQREYWNKFQESLNQNNSRRSNYSSNSQGSAVSGSASTSLDGVTAAAAPRTYGGTKGSQINWVA